jgi:uncharacterized protein DUF4388
LQIGTLAFDLKSHQDSEVLRPKAKDQTNANGTGLIGQCEGVKMQQNRFVVLTGHLNDYPLSDLVGILRHQRKTGRLLIECAAGPAHFFFQEGELVDAQLNEHGGLQAICIALAQPPASFNFNPLITPSRRSIEDSLQRTVSELFGCWDDTTVQIEAEPVDTPLLVSAPESADVASPYHQLRGREVERLALTGMVARLSAKQRASFLLMAAAGLMMLGLSTVIAVMGGFKTQNSAGLSEIPTAQAAGVASKSEARPIQPVLKNARDFTRIRPAGTDQSNRHSNRDSKNRSEANSTSGDSSERAKATKGDEQTSGNGTQAVTVVMQIENGRVLKASIANPRPGMDSYEALALRIARQRRFPSQSNGSETVKIAVGNPDK